MSERITKVTIVGGGTAGWMAATHLVSYLNRTGGGPEVEVTLIESPNVPAIGVGEATVPAMRRWLRDLGIDEAVFIRRCNASFKLGVRFANWNTDADGRPLQYIHPFHGFDFDIEGVSPAYYFHRFGSPYGSDDPVDNLSPSVALVDHYKGPRPVEPGDYQTGVRYAYHLDAGLFAKLLQETATARGVRHVLDDVLWVERDERGFVSALHLKEQGREAVELVIDCTGFKSLILQETLEEPFVPYSPYLLCDRALAVQVPHREARRLEPCTRATAIGAGWCWRVPLYSRIGTGYVFSSAFRSDDAATEEFLRHLGPEGEGAEPRAIAMRVGRSRRSWVNNCVAIGLSGGFIEPLESTAIYIIQKSLRWLAEHFPDRSYEPAQADAFNSLVEQLYVEIRDFNVLHYHTSNRTDSPFWQAARNEIEVPDSLRRNLERWRRALPSEGDFGHSYLFNYWSYMIILYGKRYFDGLRFPVEETIAEPGWLTFADRLRQVKTQLLNELPDHYELVSAIRRAAGETEAEPSFLATIAAGRAAGRATVPLPGEPLRPQISFSQGALPAGNIL
jgi:tryptophan halogenase